MLNFVQVNMGTFFLERISKLLKPDFSSNGPFEVVGLEEPQASGFSSEATFAKFTNLARSISEQFGCTSETRFKELPGNTHYTNLLYPSSIMMRQVIIVPGEGQSIGSFEAALRNISSAMSDSMNIKMIAGQSEDYVKLKELAGQFSRVLKQAVTIKQHGQYSF